MTPEARIRLLARSIADRYGHPEDLDVLSVTRDGSVVTIEYEVEGFRTRRADIAVDERFDDDISDGALGQELRARFSEVARLAGRRRALTTYGQEMPHPWSLTAPRLFADILNRYGIAMIDLHRDLDHYAGWEGRSPQGRPDVEIRSLRMDMGRICGTVAIGGDLDVVAEDDEDGCCTIRVRDVDLPESSIPALAGMPLEHMLSHRDLDGLQGHVIATVGRGESSGRPELRMSLRPDFVWCGPSPQGADVSWRDIREGVRMRMSRTGDERRF